MKPIAFVTFSLLLATACGGASPAPKQPAGAPCPDVATAAAHVFKIEAHVEDDALVARMQAMMSERCTADAWSAAARTCFVQVPQPGAKVTIDDCTKLLTPAQLIAWNNGAAAVDAAKP